VERLTISGSYGLLWNKVEQGVLFVALVPGSDAAASYSSQAQLYAINAAYQLSEQLDLSLALQQVRSLSRFEPAFKSLTVFGSSWDTGGVKEISQARTVESSLSARGDYRLSKNSSCSVDYSYRDYDNENAALFNGTVQTVMAYLTVKW
jgi:predicted porin